MYERVHTKAAIITSASNRKTDREFYSHGGGGRHVKDASVTKVVTAVRGARTRGECNLTSLPWYLERVRGISIFRRAGNRAHRCSFD